MELKRPHPSLLPVLPTHCITCTKRRGEILVAACPKPSLVSQAGDPGHGTEATSPRLDTQTVIVVRAYVLYVHAILYALRADLFVFPSSFFCFYVRCLTFDAHVLMVVSPTGATSTLTKTTHTTATTIMRLYKRPQADTRTRTQYLMTTIMRLYKRPQADTRTRTQ